LATVVFLDLNGRRPDLSDDAAFQLVMDVASGEADVVEIADRLNLAPR
jgi:death-on-curing protein